MRPFIPLIGLFIALFFNFTTAQNCTSYATLVSLKDASVVNANNSLGAPNTTVADLPDDNDYIVWNMGTVLPTGTSICVRVKKPSGGGNFDFSIWAGSDSLTFTQVGSTFSNQSNTTLTDKCVTLTAAAKYIRLTHEDASDMSVDAVIASISGANAGSDGNMTVCNTSTSIITLANLIGGETAGGTWSRASGSNGTFNAGAGTFTPSTNATTSTFRYVLGGTGGCPGDTSIATVTINTCCDGRLTSLYFNRLSGSPDIAIMAGGNYPQVTLSNLYNLEATVSGTVQSVKFIITGPTASNSTDNSSAYNAPSTGTAWVPTAGAYSVNVEVYNADDAGGTLCHDTTITFNIISCTTAGSDGNTTVCNTSTSVITLTDLISGEATGGTWSRASGSNGTFNAGAGTFTPASSATTSTFRYVIAGTGGCPNDTSIATVTITVCCTPPSTTLCTPPGTFTYTSVANGDWTSGSTWQGGSAPSLESINNKNIKITHLVAVQNNNIKLENNSVIYITGGGQLTLRNGNLEMADGNQSTTEKVLIDNGSLRTSGNVQQIGSATVFCAINSKLEIGDESATSTPTVFTAGFFSANNNYTSADFQNTNGYRRLETTCLNITHDLQNNGGTDIFINDCFEIGDQGPVSGSMDDQDRGNFQTQSTVGTDTKIYNSTVYLPSGDFINSKQFLSCNTKYKLTNGNFQNQSASSFTGQLNVIWINHPTNGNIQNSGTWDWNTIAKWRTDNSNSPSGITGTSIAESTQSSISSEFAPCNCLTTSETSSLGNFVWNDLNGDGDQDAGEPGISGVSVTLTNVTTSATTPTSTDANGKYLFSGLAPGTYKVTFGTPSGFNPSTANVGADDKDSDAGSGGMTGNYVLVSGQVDTTVDAGFYKTASLGNFVWHDLNADGDQDAGEPGISSSSVTLTNVTTSVTTPGITDANGRYFFGSLVPGTYKVTFGLPSGFVSSPANIGADDKDSDANGGGMTGNYVLISGQSDTTVDAGFYKTASLGNFVWEDVDQDGIQDGDEPPIFGGVLVTLTNVITGNSTTPPPILTDFDGKYLFTGLTPGTYKVTFSIPIGYIRTTDNSGIDSLDSDADFTTGVTGNYFLASGQTNLTVDAGFRIPANPIMPDVQPTISVLPSSFTVNSTTGYTRRLRVIVRINEVQDIATTGDPIVVRIPRTSKLSFTYNPTLASLGSAVLQNSSWTFSNTDPIYWVFTYNGVFPPYGETKFGFEATFFSEGDTGQMFFNSIIVQGGGGETNFLNNVDDERIDFITK